MKFLRKIQMVFDDTTHNRDMFEDILNDKNPTFGIIKPNKIEQCTDVKINFGDLSIEYVFPDLENFQLVRNFFLENTNIEFGYEDWSSEDWSVEFSELVRNSEEIKTN